MKKEKVIRKVAVTVGGLKGLVLSGTQEIIKENKISIDTFVNGIKKPIHNELEAKIEELRFHVLEICGLITESTTKNERIALIAGCDILAFDFELGEEGYFKIKASTRVFFDKVITLTTPKVDADDRYEFFDTVMKIIESILEEIKHFIDETKVISESELSINYIRHGKGVNVDMEAYNEMNEDEKAEFHQEALGKLGYLVNTIHVSDISGEDDEEEIVTEVTGEVELDFKCSEKTVDSFFEANSEAAELVISKLDSKGSISEEELRIAEPILLKK